MRPRTGFSGPSPVGCSEQAVGAAGEAAVGTVQRTRSRAQKTHRTAQIGPEQAWGFAALVWYATRWAGSEVGIANSRNTPQTC